jgi:hypothetical protein
MLVRIDAGADETAYRKLTPRMSAFLLKQPFVGIEIRPKERRECAEIFANMESAATTGIPPACRDTLRWLKLKLVNEPRTRHLAIPSGPQFGYAAFK